MRERDTITSDGANKDLCEQRPVRTNNCASNGHKLRQGRSLILAMKHSQKIASAIKQLCEKRPHGLG